MPQNDYRPQALILVDTAALSREALTPRQGGDMNDAPEPAPQPETSGDVLTTIFEPIPPATGGRYVFTSSVGRAADDTSEVRTTTDERYCPFPSA